MSESDGMKLTTGWLEHLHPEGVFLADIIIHVIGKVCISVYFLNIIILSTVLYNACAYYFIPNWAKSW